jgi:hypothetical protein
VICFDVLGTRKCQNFKFLTKSRFTTDRTCYTLVNFRKNPTGGVSIEMAEPIAILIFVHDNYHNNDICGRIIQVTFSNLLFFATARDPRFFEGWRNNIMGATIK